MSPGRISQILASAKPAWSANPETIMLSTTSTFRACATAKEIDWRSSKFTTPD
jgi:hypothetical protein